MPAKPNIPALRFPGFEGEWEKKKLGDVIEKIESGVSVNSDDFPIQSANEYGILKTSCVSNGMFYESENKRIAKADLHKARLNPEKDSILISRMNTPLLVGENGYVSKNYSNVFIPDRLWLAKINSDHFARTISFILTTKKARNKISDIATGTSGSMKNISQPNFLNLELYFPTLPEQRKIAAFLTAVDERLQALKRKKALLESWKKGVMQQLFSQALRFTDNNSEAFPDWEERKLGEVCEEHLKKNEKNESSEVFSVAKNKGVINQIEHLGRSFSAKEITHYKLIFPGDLVYTKSPTSDFPFGIIKQNRTGRVGVVSPMYCVFRPETYELGFLIHEYFSSSANTLNYLTPIVQKGAKNTININNEVFLNGPSILLPRDHAEQRKIAAFLSAIDGKIETVQQQIDKTETWKKGLLQQLFV